MNTITPTDAQTIPNANQVFAFVEQCGYIDPNQRPVGSVSLERAFADVALDASLQVLPLTLPEPTVPGTRNSRRGNGHGGSSKTLRAQRAAHVPRAPGAVVAAIDAFEESVAERLESCASDRRSWVEVDDDGREFLVTEYGRRSVEDIAYDQEEVLRRAERDRPVVRVEALRAQPYAKGFDTATTPEERERADRILAARKPSKQARNHRFTY